MSETVVKPVIAPVGVFGGIRNENGDYLSFETYGESVVIKIHQGDNKAMFTISHDHIPDASKDILTELKKCCDRVRSDCAITL